MGRTLGLAVGAVVIAVGGFLFPTNRCGLDVPLLLVVATCGTSDQLPPKSVTACFALSRAPMSNGTSLALSPNLAPIGRGLGSRGGSCSISLATLIPSRPVLQGGTVKHPASATLWTSLGVRVACLPVQLLKQTPTRAMGKQTRRSSGQSAGTIFFRWGKLSSR
jgi:hypothetical protein